MLSTPAGLKIPLGIIAEEGGVEAAVPRACARSTLGSSLVDVTDPSPYDRVTVSRPLISLFLTELKHRFGAIQGKMAITGNIVPSVLTRALKSATPALSIGLELKFGCWGSQPQESGDSCGAFAGCS